MIVIQDDVIYELHNSNQYRPAYAKLIKCLSNETKKIIPDSVNTYIVTEISDSAFKNCENLESIEFKDASLIRYIGKNAFENCISLKTFSIPENVNKISEKTFCNCTSLKEVTFSTNTVSIGHSAFEKCRALKSVKQISQSSLKTINKNAFKDCYQLTIEEKIDSLKFIKKDAFKNCQKVIITGDSLTYKSGTHYDSTNSSIKTEWHLSKKFIVLGFILTALSMIYWILDSIFSFEIYGFSNHLSILSLFTMLVLLAIVCFKYFKYKKDSIFLTVGIALLTVNVLLIILLTGLFFQTSNSIFNQISIYNNKLNDNYLISMITNFSDLSYSRTELVKTEYDDSSQINNTIEYNVYRIQQNSDILAEIKDYQHDKVINDFSIVFENSQTILSINTSEAPNISITSNDTQLTPTLSDSSKVEYNITDTPNFDISLSKESSTQNTTDLLFTITMNKTVFTSTTSIGNCIILILIILMGIGVLMTIALIVYNLSEYKNIIVENRILILLILNGVYVIVSVINGSDATEIISSIAANLSGA